MKKLTLFVSALALSAGMALAGPVEDTVAKMTADGYSNIEVKSGASTTKIEAVKDGQMVEITIDNENGQVIKSENESVSGDDQSAEEGDDNGGEQADDNGESHEDGDDDGGEGHEGGDTDGGEGHEGGGESGGEGGGEGADN